MTTTPTARPPAPVSAVDAVPTRLERFLEAMRPARMGPRLAAALGEAPAPCHVLDAQLEPGIRAILLYRRGPELLRADLLPDPAAEVAGVVVPPGVVISRFPHDPELPTLPGVVDREVLGEALASAVGPPSYGSARRTPHGHARLLRYRPGKRVTLLAARCGDPRRYVAKTYHDVNKAAAVASEAPRLDAVAAASQTLALAPMVTHVPTLHMVVQRSVPGTPLDALLGTRSGMDAVALAGRALAEFHGLGPATDRCRPMVGELRRFRLRAARIATVDSHVGDVLGALAERLEVLHAAFAGTPPGLVHGDCKPCQFLVAGARTYLIDLDHVGLCEQEVDVGTFLASLRQLDVRRGLLRSPPRWGGAPVARLSERFLGAYQQARGRPLEPARVRWHEAAALERKALRAFARAPRSPLPLALAGAANRSLAGLDGQGW